MGLEGEQLHACDADSWSRPKTFQVSPISVQALPSNLAVRDDERLAHEQMAMISRSFFMSFRLASIA